MDHTTFEAALVTLGLAPERDGLIPDVPFRMRRCETTDGILLDPVAALRATMLGHVRRVVFDSAGTIIDFGRKRRLFTGALREAVLLQSSTCVWPGCDRPASACHADHQQEWHERGETRAGNGGPACPGHNWEKNRGRYRVWRDPGGLWHTYRPDGTEIAPAPLPKPARLGIEFDHCEDRHRAA
jgi:hypothetical protein